MELEAIKEEDKKTLGRLAIEFGDHFLKECSEDKNIIGLYGIYDCEILNFFEGELKSYLLEKGKSVKIMQNNSAQYSIDVGFFLKKGYFKGMNKDLDGLTLE